MKLPCTDPTHEQRDHTGSNSVYSDCTIVGHELIAAGMAAAQQLARAGHAVSVFEKQDGVGGLLRYGIPDFKLAKQVIKRRMGQMKAEGVKFHINTHVGSEGFPTKRLLEEFDAVVLAGGSEQPRDLPIPGRDLDGVHFAMDFLRANSKVIQGVPGAEERLISAAGKRVVVIGGGPIGLLIGLVARQKGANVILSEVNHQRLKLAQTLGLATVNPAQQDLVEEVAFRTGAAMADVVFEVSGSAPGAEQSGWSRRRSRQDDR